MRFAPTDEQIEFSEAVRGLLADTCGPDDVRSAWQDPVLAGGGSGAGGGRVPAAWSALGEMGVLGIMVPEANGGLGLTDEDLVPLVVEAGRVALPDPLAATAGVATGTLCAALAGRAGDVPAGDVPAGMLERIAAGSASVGVLFDTSAGGIASSKLVAAPGGLDCVVVYRDRRISLADGAGVEFDAVESVDGARALGRVTAADGETLLDGPEADAASAIAFDRAALYAAAELVGLADRMVGLAVAYAGERQQFGVAIGTFQAVKHHLANAAMAVEFAKPLVMRAAHSLAHAEGGPHPEPVPLDRVSQHVSMAKARAAQAADVAARASLQVHGGIGYTVEYDLHLFMKRAWVLSRQYGDAAFHTRRVRASLALG